MDLKKEYEELKNTEKILKYFNLFGLKKDVRKGNKCFMKLNCRLKVKLTKALPFILIALSMLIITILGALQNGH